MKLPMTAPSAPAPGTRMATSTPVVGKPPGNNASDRMGGGGTGRNEAFSRGHTAKVSTPAQAHHIAKTRGGNTC